MRTMRTKGWLAVIVTLCVAAAGIPAVPADDDFPDDDVPAYPACEHPWPCGNEWPDGLEGPFPVVPSKHVQVKSHDGILLDGLILRPQVPAGVRVPVVLIAAPYFGQALPPIDDPELWDMGPMPARMLAENGTAVALFNVRGTGDSGGCIEWFGPNETKDQAVLIDWLADQQENPWSNGRVGMWGISYLAGTAFGAAIQNPTALKTIVVSGLMTDPYTFFYTPQGAALSVGPLFAAQWTLLNAYGPGLPRVDPAHPDLDPIVKWASRLPNHVTPQRLGSLPQRVCPELARVLATLHMGAVTDMRDSQVWKARQFIDQFPNVKSSVLIAHGFEDQDLHGSAHSTQESAVWASLTKAPKAQFEGPWYHEFPNTNRFHPELARSDWNRTMLDWFDFWLKGHGAPPAELGVMEYQDNTGIRHPTSAWPPLEAHEEVLYLADKTLLPAPGGASQRFLSALDPRDVDEDASNFVWAALCTDGVLVPGQDPPFSVAYWSEPLKENVLLAGNPFAYLRLSSDQPGGMASIALVDVGPDFHCTLPDAIDARLLVRGFADLRFHQGNYGGRDFPVGTPTNVRIDITNLAEVLESDHRLVAIVSYGDGWVTGQPYTPTVTVDAKGGIEASHLVLPIVKGTFGGNAPTLVYPCRPFTPVPIGQEMPCRTPDESANALRVDS